MSRIADCFERIRTDGRTGLVTYVTAGDPDLERSASILESLDRAGADVLEVGVPFSDPLADGPVIQRATERALAAGATLTTTLDLVGRIRETVTAPIVIFTYVNPVLALGLDRFVTRAAKVGVDGALVLDLPMEEADEMRAALSGAGIDPIFLISPTTSDARIGRAAEIGSGFLYGISRLGVTGARDTIAEGARPLVERIRRLTTLPVALGFGISRPEHVVEVGRWADAAVVGSALVTTIANASNGPDLTGEVDRYVRWLKSGRPQGAT